MWVQVHLLAPAEVCTGSGAHSKCFTDVSASPVSRRQEACEEPTAGEKMAAGPMREEHGTWIRKEVDSILQVDRIKLSKLGLVQSIESLTEGAQAMGNGQGPIEQ